MKLSFKDGRQNKMHIFVDGEYSMTADRDFVLSCGYRENSEIDDEELADLRESVSSRRAFNKACDLLSRRDHSEKELIQKLREKGYAEGAEEAAEKLCEYGYIDDERFARTYAAELQRVKGFGKRRILQELFRKGIDREIADEVLDELVFDEETVAAVLRKKYGRCLDTEKGVKRAFAGLQRMGYGYGEIKDALETVLQELECGEDEFE